VRDPALENPLPRVFIAHVGVELVAAELGNFTNRRGWISRVPVIRVSPISRLVEVLPEWVHAAGSGGRALRVLAHDARQRRRGALEAVRCM